MAETILSPGVLAVESDRSQITEQPVSVGAALLGPTVLGKVNIPTVTTSYSDFLSKFGGAFDSGSGAGLKQYSYLTSISAQNYFANGGTTLLVTRIASGTFAPATSSGIFAELETDTLDPLSIILTSSLSIQGFSASAIIISLHQQVMVQQLLLVHPKYLLLEQVLDYNLQLAILLPKVLLLLLLEEVQAINQVTK